MSTLLAPRQIWAAGDVACVWTVVSWTALALKRQFESKWRFEVSLPIGLVYNQFDWRIDYILKRILNWQQKSSEKLHFQRSAATNLPSLQQPLQQ